MIVERSRDFSFSVPNRRGQGLFPGKLGQDSFELDYGDYSFDQPSFDMSMNWEPIDLEWSTPTTPEALSEGGVSTSPMVDSSSVDWGSMLQKLTQYAVPLATAGTAIYKSVTGEGQPTAAKKVAPAGYMYNAQGQLVPITGAGSGTNWMLIGALALGAYMLAKR